MKNLLLAPNSFKECTDSVEVASLFKKYLSNSNLKMIEKPISDGGDGFRKVCKVNYRTKSLSYSVTRNYSDDLINIKVEYSAEDSIIFIESADLLGLKVVPKENRNPAVLSSKNLGDLIKKLAADCENGKISVKKVIIGIGGTATNDLGLGACSYWGLKLFDKNSKELEVIPKFYSEVREIKWQGIELPFRISCIVDVNNGLLGENGATLKFAGQKGAKDEDLVVMEKGFRNIIRILEKQGLVDADNLSGAGGGLAAGLSIFFDSEIKEAKDFILYDLGISKVGKDADFILTGEGAFDEQSLMNKGTGVILDFFKNSNKKVFLCAGRIDKKIKEVLDKNVYCVELSKYFSSADESIKNYEYGIKLACKEIINMINS